MQAIQFLKSITNKSKNKKGMTLLEIIIVFSIIGLLASFLYPKIANMQKKSRYEQAKLTMGEIAKSLNMYAQDCGQLPPESVGLAGLASSEGTGCNNWGPEPYMKKVPNDPWGTPFLYSIEGGNYTLMSYGEDKKEGGDGYGKDIVFDQ